MWNGSDEQRQISEEERNEIDEARIQNRLKPLFRRG